MLCLLLIPPPFFPGSKFHSSCPSLQMEAQPSPSLSLSSSVRGVEDPGLWRDLKDFAQNGKSLGARRHPGLLMWYPEQECAPG